MGFGDGSSWIGKSKKTKNKKFGKNKIIWDYSDETIKLIRDKINNLKADLGGTDILSPL